MLTLQKMFYFLSRFKNVCGLPTSFRPLFVSIFMISFLTACVTEQPLKPPVTAPSNLFDPTEIIALIPANGDVQGFKVQASNLGFILLEDARLDSLNERMLRFTFPSPLDGKGAIAALEALDVDVTAGVNHGYSAAATSEVAARFEYANDLINWPQNACRALGPVGLIDTGIAKGRATVSDTRIISKDFTRGGASLTRHGTDVSSILTDPNRVKGATIYNAAVIARRLDGRDLTGVDGISKALNWLSEENIRVVNLSLVGPYNKILDRVVTQAVDSGMILVAAVGNDGTNSPARYPAALDGVIAVTAVDAKMRIYTKAVRGGFVDLAAPGVDIAVPDEDQTRVVTGTSMAAPFVVSRILTDASLYGSDADGVVKILAASSIDLGPRGKDNTFGSGLLQGVSACEG